MIIIGALDNVPAPGDAIRSPWAQEISGYVVHPFASVAQRDAVWTAPPAGSMCITLDTGYRWQRVGSAWLYIGGGNPPLHAFRANRTAAHPTLTGMAWNNIIFDTKEYDPNTNYNTSSGVYTAPVAGLYMWSAVVSFAANNNPQPAILALHQNGAQTYRGTEIFARGVTGGDSWNLTGSGLVLAGAAGNTYDIRVYNGATNACTMATAPYLCNFSMARIP
jgi:hypothetical protein